VIRSILVMVAATACGPKPKPRPPDATPRITITGNEAFDESTLVPSQMVVTISNTYMAGLERCYAEVLGRDPSARGTVVIVLTVTANGTVANPKVRAFADLGGCVESQVRTWSFPIPAGADGNPTDANFQITLAFETS